MLRVFSYVVGSEATTKMAPSILAPMESAHTPNMDEIPSHGSKSKQSVDPLKPSRTPYGTITPGLQDAAEPFHCDS